ncbi:4Fe-4S dicluster domain-containing protein, partial [bacterium]|nr:4Fe-4S dicluster domain-containing protein [bacterium]
MTEPKKPKRPRGKARFIEGKCIACGARCQSACPVDGIEMGDSGEPLIHEDKCIGCVKCVKACPGNALEIFYTPEELAILALLEQEAGQADDEVDEEERLRREAIAAWRGVWVFVEQTEGEPARVSWELMGAGAELARSVGTELCAVVIG